MTVTPAPLGLIFWLGACCGAFLIGSIPFGPWISRRVAGVDIGRRGSGNIGATNVAREIGPAWGALTLVLDSLKGFVPVFLATRLLPGFESGACSLGLCAILGHQFSLFRRGRGGKGVATSLGVFLSLAPGPTLAAGLLFLLTVYLTRFVSLGSMVAALGMPIFLLVSGGPAALILTALVAAGLIVLKHRGNIQRLVRGEERKWGSGKLTSAVRGADPAPRRSRSR